MIKEKELDKKTSALRWFFLFKFKGF